MDAFCSQFSINEPIYSNPKSEIWPETQPPAPLSLRQAPKTPSQVIPASPTVSQSQSKAKTPKAVPLKALKPENPGLDRDEKIRLFKLCLNFKVGYKHSKKKAF